MMNIKLKKKEIINMLEKYYKEEQDMDSKISIHVSKEFRGYGMAEAETAVIHIKQKGNMEFMGQTVPVERDIEEDEIKEVFKAIIEAQGYQFVNLQMLSDLESEIVGYYMSERVVEKPVFRGIEISFNQKNKEKIFKKEGM